MQEKYLIHADVRASGVVERSDVVGAIFGQTEGLLGDDLDLRGLQESSKVGRIDVQIDSEGGRSFGTVTIASGLERAETAVLAAALETIDRIGPCRAEFEVRELEDARAAKRREVVERATELLAEFEEATLSSRELVEEVRRNVRVADIAEFEGLPAGPRVADSDAIIVVEGRADVLQLLKYGIKNAIAVEGTDVPDAVSGLTGERTVTAFLDGDRGGDLILKELAQVGDVDYVAFAPAGRSVEDLSRNEVLSALREKVPYDRVAEASSPRAALGSDRDAPEEGVETAPEDRVDADGGTAVTREDGTDDPAGESSTGTTAPDLAKATQSDGDTTAETDRSSPSGTDEAADAVAETTDPESPDRGPETLAGHVNAVAGTGRVRLLDTDFRTVSEDDAGSAFEAIESAPDPPHAVVLDGELSQRILDVAAQRGVTQVVAGSEGEFVKRPTSVRVRTADGF